MTVKRLRHRCIYPRVELRSSPSESTPRSVRVISEWESVGLRAGTPWDALWGQTLGTPLFCSPSVLLKAVEAIFDSYFSLFLFLFFFLFFFYFFSFLVFLNVFIFCLYFGAIIALASFSLQPVGDNWVPFIPYFPKHPYGLEGSFYTHRVPEITRLVTWVFATDTWNSACSPGSGSQKSLCFWVPRDSNNQRDSSQKTTTLWALYTQAETCPSLGIRSISLSRVLAWERSRELIETIRFTLRQFLFWTRII